MVRKCVSCWAGVEASNGSAQKEQPAGAVPHGAVPARTSSVVVHSTPCYRAAGRVLQGIGSLVSIHDVTAGQSGKVWFLASPFGTVERTYSIPAGTSLFVSLLNAEASDQ